MGLGELCVGMETKIEVNTMKNEHVIIAALAIALAGTGYYAYTEHQQVQDLQAQVDSTKKKLAQVQVNATDLQAQVKDLQSKNSDLQDRINNPPVPDVMKEMEEAEIRQKTSDYLDKVNRQLDDEYFDSKVEIPDFLK